MRKKDNDIGDASKINADDQKRIRCCDEYLRTKQIMKNAEAYKNLRIDEVYFIKYKESHYNGPYVSTSWNGKEPAKYMVFHNDNGFVFVKRIISGGKVGKEVTCLTTTYNEDYYELEADPDYVNSILLDDEDGYDPLAASKKLASDKGKARRKNKKLEIAFDDVKKAQTHMGTLKKGDLLYQTSTSYGAGISTWEVKSITKRKTNQDKSTVRWGNHDNALGNTEEDREHNREGFKDFVSAEIIRIDDSVSYKSDRTVIFNCFTSGWGVYYKSKPYTTDDV